MKRKTYKKYRIYIYIYIYCDAVLRTTTYTRGSLTRSWKLVFLFLGETDRLLRVLDSNSESLTRLQKVLWYIPWRLYRTVVGAALVLVKLVNSHHDIKLLLSVAFNLCRLYIVSEYNMFRWDSYHKGNNRIMHGEISVQVTYHFYFSSPPPADDFRANKKTHCHVYI